MKGPGQQGSSAPHSHLAPTFLLSYCSALPSSGELSSSRWSELLLTGNKATYCHSRSGGGGTIYFHVSKWRRSYTPQFCSYSTRESSYVATPSCKGGWATWCLTRRRSTAEVKVLYEHVHMGSSLTALDNESSFLQGWLWDTPSVHACEVTSVLSDWLFVTLWTIARQSGFSVHWILQGRILQWLPGPPPGDLSEPCLWHLTALIGSFFITSTTCHPYLSICPSSISHLSTYHQSSLTYFSISHLPITYQSNIYLSTYHLSIHLSSILSINHLSVFYLSINIIIFTEDIVKSLVGR